MTVVPLLVVGTTRLENVPFWVAPDDRLPWAGVMGIDILLKLETLRWDAKGTVEIGFPAQEMDIRKANLCFLNNGLLVEVSSKGLSPMIFFFDTGNNETHLLPRLAMDNLDLIAANSELVPGEWHAHGRNGKLVGLKVPKLQLEMGGAAVPLDPATVMLHTYSYFDCHGTIGTDILNRAKRVSLDLHAMRLTIE